MARTELQTLFYSPVAWLILIIFAFQAGMAFSDQFAGFVQTKKLGYSLNGVTLNLFLDPWRGFFTRIQDYLYFYIPLLTMGMMSRELSSGSIKLLYSSPISNREIILGKFLSIMIYALVMTGILFVFVLYGAIFVVKFDFIATLSGLLGLFLMICAYGAIGLFMSSLTSYQVVAAMGTFAVFAALSYVSRLWQDIAFVRDITYWLSINGRSEEFISGMICSEDVIYFLTVIGLFLSLSILRLNVIRQKSGWSTAMSRYMLAVGIAVLVGYLSSRPKLMWYYDTTRTKILTLTQNSQDIMAKMKDGLTITTYANILDEDRLIWFGTPRAELDDRKRLKQYTRFKPEIKMKYVRYYVSGNNAESLNKRYPNLGERGKMVKIAQSYGVDSTIYIAPEEVIKLENLAPENFRFVKSLERENGRKTFLRVFNDMMLFPGETEITAAFKRLVMELPHVGFVEGHGERDCIKEGDRDYNRFAQEKVFRYSLINQGFDIRQTELEKEVPEDIDILVLADIRTSLSAEHLEHLNKFIARGGNLLIAGEPKRQEVMNPVIEQFGVRFLEGCLVKPNKNFQPDLIFAVPTEEGAALSYHINNLRRYEQVITMPSVTGLDYSEAAHKGFKATPLFVTDTAGGTWNEVETTDFVDDTVRLNPEKGEIAKASIPTAVALSRTIGDKEQKIIILGDADCISNEEISRSRKNIPASNYSLIVASFYWMSDDEVPIDVRRPPFTDNDIRVNKLGMSITKVAFMGIIPATLAFFSLFIWIRRRGR